MVTHVDRMRDKAKAMAPHDPPGAVTSLRIWHCKYTSVASIARFANLRELAIAGFPDDSLQMLSGLAQLRYLKILHLPKVTSLEPIGSLRRLESLSLATSPAWDAAGKVQAVASLAPVSRLAALRHIELFGVRPPDASLEPLERCRHLQSARVSQYPAAEVARFRKAVGVSDAFNPPASFDAASDIRSSALARRRPTV